VWGSALSRKKFKDGAGLWGGTAHKRVLQTKGRLAKPWRRFISRVGESGGGGASKLARRLG